MKLSKTIALMLIGMIAFSHVEAMVHSCNAPPTKCEPAVNQSEVLKVMPCQNNFKVEAPALAMASVTTFNLPEMEVTKTTTRVKVCKPCPCDVRNHIHTPLKIGWCS